jgi:hypothetical protein
MLPMKDSPVAYAHIGFYLRDYSYLNKSLELKRDDSERIAAITII